MSGVLAIAAPLALLVGVVLGLLGGGGSMLTVPLLVYVVGMAAKPAIATSLFVVAVTSLAGVLAHARAGTIRWRTGLVFGAAGMLGAFLGGLVGARLPARILLAAFAVMMLATAFAMLRGRRNRGPRRRDHARVASGQGGELPLARVLGNGFLVGLVTGMVGAGGGFMVVPALVLLGGLPMPVAVGTSLVVIAMNSLAGFAGYLSRVPIDWVVALAVTSASVVGAIAGARLAAKVSPNALRRGFAWFIAVMGVFIFTQQLAGNARWIALGAMGGIVIVAAVCASLWPGCPIRGLIRA